MDQLSATCNVKRKHVAGSGIAKLTKEHLDVHAFNQMSGRQRNHCQPGPEALWVFCGERVRFIKYFYGLVPNSLRDAHQRKT